MPGINNPEIARSLLLFAPIILLIIKLRIILSGFKPKILNIGHAVVFVKLKNEYYIIDPTYALEGTGVKKINNCGNLRDAVSQYSSLPCEVYKIPSYENEKKVINYIY